MNESSVISVTEAALKQGVEIIQSVLPEVLAVYLFGSQTQKAGHAESDLDLAILVAEPVPALQHWELQEELAQHLGIDVDLIDLRSATTVMQVQIIHTGTLLLEADPYQRAVFEMRVYSAYALLNEERRYILEDIQKRGRVYGG